LFLFLLPLLLAQLSLRPFFPAEHHWADFAYTLAFFLCGYIAYADERFLQAVRRDWALNLAAGIISTLYFFGTASAGVALDWMSDPGLWQFYLGWAVFAINSWCWTLVVLAIGQRYLDFRNRWLEYGQRMIMPFFLFHQPVIIAIAFYVVQWEAGLLVKLLTVVLGSFVVSLGLYELVRRIKPLAALFGAK
jgi:surface polysaccharide O-acyltransferase-like enzyme